MDVNEAFGHLSEKMDGLGREMVSIKVDLAEVKTNQQWATRFIVFIVPAIITGMAIVVWTYIGAA